MLSGVLLRSRCVQATIGAMSLAVSLAAGSAAGSTAEDEVKAAFLFRFVQFIEWPDAAFETKTAPIRISTLSSSDFVETLRAAVEGRSVHGRSVVVSPISNIEQAHGSQVLYVEAGRGVPMAAVGVLSSDGVFTVGSQTGFAGAGGLANFFTTDGKLRFEINEQVARRAGLRISSRLLRLARVVD